MSSLSDARIISSLVTKICESHSSHSDLEDFIHYCKSMVVTILWIKKSRGQFYIPFREESDKEIDDVAIDLLAPLFQRDQEGKFIRLDKYFRPFLKEITKNPDQVHSLLKRLLYSHVNQELTEIYRQENPAGWKLYRNILLSAQRNEAIQLIKIQSDRYLIYNEDSDQDPNQLINNNLPEIEYSVLLSLLKKAMSVEKTTPKYLAITLKNLQDDPHIASQISVTSLHHAIQDILNIQTIQINGGDITTRPQINSITKDEMVDQVNVLVQKQLVKTYFHTQKVSKNILDRYQSILQTFFYDLVWMGKTGSITDYMNHIEANKILESDWSNHKNRLEYVIQKGKKYLQEVFSQY